MYKAGSNKDRSKQNGQTLQWRHNESDGVSNHRCLDCLLSRLFRRRSKEISKLRVTGLCEGNSPVTSEFRTQRASHADNVFLWWRHHGWGHQWIGLGFQFGLVGDTVRVIIIIGLLDWIYNPPVDSFHKGRVRWLRTFPCHGVIVI